MIDDLDCPKEHRHGPNGCEECEPNACGYTAADLANNPEGHAAGAPPDGICFVHGLDPCGCVQARRNLEAKA